MVLKSLIISVTMLKLTTLTSKAKVRLSLKRAEQRSKKNLVVAHQACTTYNSAYFGQSKNR